MKKKNIEIKKDSCGGVSFSTNEHCDSKDLLESLLSISKNLESSIEKIHEIETGGSCAGEANLQNCVPYCYGGSYCVPARPQTCAAYCPGGEYCIPASQENCIPFINERSCNLCMPPIYFNIS